MIDLAVERCKANTVTAQWGNCAPGRWIDTGRYLVVAAVCDARDTGGEDHRLLEFMKDGVTASDDQIRDAVQRETPYAIPDGGCRKVAVYDATRPDLSNQEEPGFARSVAKERSPSAEPNASGRARRCDEVRLPDTAVFPGRAEGESPESMTTCTQDEAARSVRPAGTR